MWDQHMAAGRALQSSGHYPEAKEQFEAAVRVSTSFAPTDERNFASRIALGVVTASIGQYKEAEQWDNEAIRLGMDVYGEEAAALAIPFTNLAILYRDQGDYSRAEEFCRRALRLISNPAAVPPATLARVLGTLGGILYHRGNLLEAEGSLRQSIKIAESLRPDSEILAGDLNNLAGVYVKTGRNAEALAALQEAYTLYSKTGGSNDPNLVYVLIGMADVRAEMGQFMEAVTAVESAIRLAEAGGAGNTILMRDALVAEASWLHKLNRKKEAKRVEAKAKQVAKTAERNSYLQYTVDAHQVGTATVALR
jgi:tetratricopeptide (TPR) repeat protein